MYEIHFSCDILRFALNEFVFLRYGCNNACGYPQCIADSQREGSASLLHIAKVKYWTQELILILIQYYEVKRCLWAVKSQEYRDRQKKEAAIASIVIETKKENDAITSDAIKNKWHNMRSQFARERRQVKK